jgi:ubiquinone biosynthesis protein COQ9
MSDTTHSRRQIAAAALTLASQKPWADVTLLDIAGAAKISLADLRKSFGAKSQVVAAIMRGFDDQVLEQAAKRAEGQPARDQVFEVIMSRFDVMTPHKAAMKSIAAASPTDTSLLMPFLNSQRWMLAAAGINADGPAGFVRTAGLGTVYMSVFNVWLNDDDAGMSKTMAALDQRLRRGERTLGTIEGVVGGVTRIATDLPGVLRSVLSGGRRPASEPKADT